jgi:solute carrier family 35, member E3
LTTPCVALLQFIFLGKTVSGPTIAALTAVCIGVGLTNTGSGAAGTTALGASIAVAAFTVTAFYQVWIGKKIKDFNVSSPQLLLNQAPISVFMLAFMVPLFDTIPDVSLIPKETRIALFMSGFAAALLVRPLPFIHLIRSALTTTESFPISHYWKNECVDL